MLTLNLPVTPLANPPRWLLLPSVTAPVSRRQAIGSTPAVLAQVLEDEVNLGLWQRQLPAHIADFAELLLSLDQPLAESLSWSCPTKTRNPICAAWLRGSVICRVMKALSPMLPGWSALLPACSGPGASGCACGSWTRPCARGFTWTMYRCG